MKDQVLLAALACSNGDLNKEFSFEELLVAAWKGDPIAWGLKGFERQYPDSERIHRELDSRGKGQKGVVDLGYLEKVQARTYRLTPAGLARASQVSPHDAEMLEQADRALEAEIRRILEHPVFVAWLKEQKPPKNFRDAGHFWGIAPGTPAKVIRRRVQAVENTLGAAQALLENRGVDRIGERRRGLLFEQEDIRRALDFQTLLKSQFETDLQLLTGGRLE